ncbi:MAG: glycine cleavage system protein GcvH [Elusimicrobia bacterium]|nr:glycine cleavage system protein GcvH [Elusimicrobiota bacterium]MBD3411919.1 glycine cleavage system protein GcvH [Elusimicrobiota bacterium]
MKLLDNLRYTKTHEWARKENDEVVVGITDHAQHEISDIVHIELPALGKKVEAGKPVAVVESVKAAFDINAPVTGVVSKINTELETTPELPNKDPYGSGWLFVIQPDLAHEYDALMNASQYEKITGAH